MIVKITFKDLENKEFTMLFGNSYKHWFTQFEEFINDRIRWWDSNDCIKCDVYKITDVSKATDDWKGFGGLKWCDVSSFQDELNEEAKGKGFKKARHYQDMYFAYNKSAFYKTRALLKQRLRKMSAMSNVEIAEKIKTFQYPQTKI
tara:strand:- start:88 stop:525 length:438 start_codon:yes stop_codon:yes gene_type:complete